MKVRNLQCSNVELPYSHVNGILEFDMRMCEPNDDNKYEFFIEADGIPDPYYLSPFALQTAHPELRPRMARLMGQRTSIFTRDYVALTALSHWYPQALDEYSDTRTKASKNLIDLALAVDLPHEPLGLVGNNWRASSYAQKTFRVVDFY